MSWEFWRLFGSCGVVAALLGAALMFLLCARELWRGGSRMGAVATVLVGWGLVAAAVGYFATGGGK